MKLLCARCAHSLCAAVVHNVNPDLLRNEAAQCKTVVRSAWHNGFARVSGAIPAWHNGFGIVRIFFDGFFFFNTIQYYIRNLDPGVLGVLVVCPWFSLVSPGKSKKFLDPG